MRQTVAILSIVSTVAMSSQGIDLGGVGLLGFTVTLVVVEILFKGSNLVRLSRVLNIPIESIMRINLSFLSGSAVK